MSSPYTEASSSGWREGSLYPDGSGRAPTPRSPRKALLASPSRAVTPCCDRTPSKKKGKNLTHYFKNERPAKRGNYVVPKFLTRSRSKLLQQQNMEQDGTPSQ